MFACLVMTVVVAVLVTSAVCVLMLLWLRRWLHDLEKEDV